MIGITNASPLIYLGKLGIIELLPKLFSRVITTTTVKEEVLQVKAAPEYPILTEVFESWLEVMNVEEELVQKIAALQIHRAEAEVIALGRELLAKEEEIICRACNLLHAESCAPSGVGASCLKLAEACPLP